MSENSTQGVGQPGEQVVDNWASVDKDFGQNTQSPPQPSNTAATTGAAATTEPADETIIKDVPADKPADAAENKPPGDNSTGDKPAETTGTGDKPAEEKPFEFSLEDINKENLPAEEGTWLKKFQERGLEVPADFSEEKGPELILAAEEKKWQSKVEEARGMTLDSLLSSVKPETATKLKLIEMGWSEEQIFAPTRHVQELIKLDDSAIVRKDLEAMGYPADVVDMKMQAIVADPTKLKLEAEALRHDLKIVENDIIKQHESVIQQYEASKEKALVAQKEQDRTQFKEALSTVEKFLDVPVKPEVKEAILKKYNAGLYENILNTPKSKVELIMQLELGHAVAKHLQNTAFEKGRETIKKDLSNIPPVTTGGQRTASPRSDDNWSAVERDFQR